MSNRHLLRLMADYHPWAYGRLLESVDRMAETDYRHDFGLAFRSVHGTLNHLLVVEHLWRERLQQTPCSATRLDQEMQHDRAQLRASLSAFAAGWGRLVDDLDGVDEPELGRTLAYQNLQGIELALPLAPLILHVFNHASHHRGQISAVLTRLGFPAPAMDLPYYMLEQPEFIGPV